MLFTTGFNFEGYKIKKYLNIVTAEVIIGTGIFSSLNAAISDISGTRSTSYEKKLHEGKESALQKLSQETSDLGGNAIIGVDIDYTTFSGDVIGVVVTGTAVLIEKDNLFDNHKNILPVLSYNSSLPFNICNIEFQSSNESNVWCSVMLKNYNEKGKIKAIFTSIELENIFGKVTTIKDMVFVFDTKDFDSFIVSKFAKLNSDNFRTDLLEKVYLSIEKILFWGDNNAIPVNQTMNKKNETLSSCDIITLKDNYGKDVVCDKEVRDNSWICFCGAENAKVVDECYRCHRKFGWKNGDIYEEEIDNKHEEVKQKINEIIDEIVKKKTASDIYDYVSALEYPILNGILNKLRTLVAFEMSTDQVKKDEAIDMIISYLYQ